MGRLHGLLSVYVLAGIPALVVALLTVIAILTAGGFGGAQDFPMPQPAPVGP